jgi:mannose-1-phosphate guanylyltransferase
LTKKNILIPVILCGGLGSRLWPLSRKSFPKQYLKISPQEDYSLLQKTIKRLEGLYSVEKPIIICNEEQRFIVAEQLREINIKANSIILEPYGRNTAPAITIASIKAIKEFDDPILLILSSDHEILDIKKFHEGINIGIKEAQKNKLITFGIVPTYPETGFGYIKAKEDILNNNLNSSEIEKFHEKPKPELAEKFIKDRRFFWNSGMFMFKAKIVYEEVKRFNPNLVQICKESFDINKRDLDFQRLREESFKLCPSISIDNAVMEMTNIGVIIPLDIGWSDIGSWYSIWEKSNKDEKGNVIIGNVLAKDIKNSYVRSESRLIVSLGIKDLIIVETNDALLVTEKSKVQEIKEIVKELEKGNFKEAEIHNKVFRPWGNYFSVEEGLKWKIKKIEVNPGAALSLQKHQKRSEHWVVVKGTAKVQIEEKIFLLSENQSTYIPKGVKHRLSNPQKSPLIIIEVQSGSYLGEDDIIRFEDNYGRLNK